MSAESPPEFLLPDYPAPPTGVPAEPVQLAPEPVAEAVAPEPEKDEIDRLLEQPVGPVRLSSGTMVSVKRLKLREFLALLKILTRGGASVLATLELDMNDANAFTQNILAAVLFALPEAPDEAVDFVQEICEPVGLSGVQKDDLHARTLLMEELENPELEDMIDILTVVVRNEATDIQSLGKRLRTMFSTAQKLGATRTQ